MRVLFLLATLGLALAAGPLPGADPAESEVKVTRLFGKDGRPAKGCGSGTVVASGVGVSRILTNYHVTPDEGHGVTVTHAGKEYKASLIAWDSTIDLACLEVKGELPAVRIANDIPAPGAPLCQWGHPGGCREAVAKVGRAVGITSHRTNGFGVFSTTIQSANGDSGAGVFDAAGNLVGVCWGGPLDHSSECCVPLADVRRFLQMDPPKESPKVYQPMPRSADCPPGQP